ncbi:MAG: O-antigen ligase family protein, partial [Methylococcales bacterium]|nr:O-antigen ligase family protein [Methylococcales bacterium]
SGLGHFGKLRTGQTDKQKNFVVVLVGFVGLIVALVRGGWLAFMAGFFVLILPAQINGGFGNILRALWRKWWPILTVIFGCALIFAALYSDLLIGRVTQPKNHLEDRSISERISENETAISIIKEHPWMGIGAGNYLHHVRLSAPLGTNVHNIPLLMGAETGLLGMALWIILLLMPLLRKGALSKNRAGMVLWISYLVISLVHRQPGMVMEPEAGMVFGLLLAGVAVTQLES